MNKAFSLIAIALIVGGFLLVTFSYASPTGSNGTPYVPELPDNNNNNLPDPPNEYNPPYQESDDVPWHEQDEPEPTPVPDDGETPETYVTKYFTENAVINVTYDGVDKRYEGSLEIKVAYPVAHTHGTHVVVSVSSGMSMSVYRNGGLTDQYGPTTGHHDYLGGSSSADTVTWRFFIYGSNSKGYAKVTLYVTDWPSSKLSIFGSAGLDMTAGVVAIIAGLALFFLTGKR